MEIILFVLVMFAMAFFASNVKGLNTGYTYKQRPGLLTKAERSFYGVLQRSTDHSIFAKVRIADVITPDHKGKEYYQAFNRISAKHFDFVLCHPETLDFIAVIELDDSSHNSERAKKRDKLVNSACKTAKIPLIRFKARRSYKLESVREQLAVVNGEVIEEKQAS